MKTRAVRPAGFTLVELLMVILIIGMLASLITAAAMFAIKAAKRTAIKIELSNLESAMQDLGTKSGGEYPPCMAIPAGVQARNDQFDRAIRKRFPRCTQNYIAVNAVLTGATTVMPGWTGWHARASDLNSNNFVTLNLNTMDAAEALVFWLAGPPTAWNIVSNPPVPLGGGGTALYGFSANAASPFAPIGSRTSSAYTFDEKYLSDADGDGWPEYVPPGINKTQVAPYVYFDPAGYTYTSGAAVHPACYPGRVMVYGSGAQSFDYPIESTLAGNWGYAVPYADSPTPTVWNPTKFQIISSGLDSEYGGAQSDSLGIGRPSMPLVPKKGSNYMPTILQGDWDNQVNFVDGVLEDETGQ